MKIVIKLGGSLSIENGPKISYLKEFRKVVNSLKKHHNLTVSIGGGKLTRNYAKSIENSNLTDKQKEEIYIDLIKANVRFLSYFLKAKPIFELKNLNNSKIQVIGGIKPGRSTDANAAIAAKNADLFIKLTNVSGIYDKDPKKHKSAKKINKISFNELKKINHKNKPNDYGVLDSMAIELIRKNKIPTVVCNGRDPKIIFDILKGKKIGTKIE